MKKVTYVIMGLACILLVAVLIVKLGKNDKEAPVDRYNDQQLEEKEDVLTIEEMSDEQVFDSNVKLAWEQLTIEVISCEIVDDDEIEKQTIYQKDNFCHEELPIANATETYTDREAIANECPEIKSFWDGTVEYSENEIKQLFEDNEDIIKKYTYEVPVDMKYVFVKCNVTNNTSKTVTVSFSDLSVIATNKDGTKWSDYRDFENIQYFDKAVNREGDARTHSFYQYSFEPNESMECTFGFWVHDEIEVPMYYLGQIENQFKENNDNPAKGKYMLKLYTE